MSNSEMIYKPIIDGMMWSYSRLKTFEDCPYRFFLKYLTDADERNQFYSSYGSLVHKLLADFYNGTVRQKDLSYLFLSQIQDATKDTLKPKSTIVQSYIADATSYLDTFTPFVFEKCFVEHKSLFKIKNYPFIGYIDYLGQNNRDFTIIDHKSRKLGKEIHKNGTYGDALREMVRQLYVYSAAVKCEFGTLPKKLCFNCFRENKLIEIPFRDEDYQSTIRWVQETIDLISKETDFRPHVDWFTCNYICDVNHECCYADDIRIPVCF